MALANDLERERAALTMIHAQPFNAEAPPEALETDVTPTELHYVRSNFPVPEHDGRLEVGGAVEDSLALTLDDLRSMRSIERVVTLECAGNGRLAMRPLPAGEPWGDYAVSTASWKGALLHEVLERAKPLGDGVEVLFACADHGSYILNPVLKDVDASDLSFERSLTLVHAADPSAEILIAYEMNGEPLNPDHGAPFRLIVPHWYGVASVKWLSRIEVLTQPFVGEFETGHYLYQWADKPPERVTLMRPRARITDPHRGAMIRAGEPCVVRGKAWSGTGPVTNVDLSLTGESAWLPAHLETPKGPYQWQSWSFEWVPTEPGRTSLRARATDVAGNAQPEVPIWNRLGYGNNAIEVVYVDVR
jgi:DMSO/TMAO reductase YedYZ molybdopterin-dependent catalytic subunit